MRSATKQANKIKAFYKTPPCLRKTMQGIFYEVNAMNTTIETTIKNLEKNNMQGYYCETSAEALDLIKSLLPEGCTVSHGGSETLKEVGVTAMLANGKYNYLDRSKCQTAEETEKLYRDCFSADVYLTSTNALTKNGELYNVDGNSNRVACIAFGPESVIVVTGINKLVDDIDMAVERVKKICAPLNTKRLNLETFCSTKGQCVSTSSVENPFVCDGCSSNARICCNYLISAQQRKKNRIKVIIINENLGY